MLPSDVKLFDKFEEIVDENATWRSQIQRALDEKLRDRDDMELDVRASRERRKRVRIARS
jgi:hypothetical protein